MEPQLADNIGMVARAMANFGLDEMRLVAPRDGWPNEKARIAASGANYVIDDGKAFPNLPSALGDLNWVAATTARQRDLRKPVLTPLEAVAEMRMRIARGERCGILFGRERNGLE
ncbi:MAG: TrmH family RNA methyltransferase, partial [Hyphomicrobiaceae bacterium]